MSAFVLLLICLTLGAGWFAGPGTLRIDTRLADIGPLDTHQAISPLVGVSAGQAREFASRQLTVFLESTDEDALDSAAVAVQSALVAIEGLQVRKPDAIARVLTTTLDVHRFSLLPESDQVALDSGDEDLLIDEALSALFSPTLVPRPLDVHSDPSNVFGRWLIDMIPESASIEASANYRRIDAQLDDTITHVDAVIELWLAARDVLKQEHPKVTLRHTGVPLFAHEAAARSRADVNWISIGSLIGISALLLPVFRSAWPLLLPALSIVVGAATGFLLVALVQPSVHVLTLVFGASLIGIVIDYSVHGFVHRCVTVDSNTVAVGRDDGLLRALTLSLATSAAAYAALGFSGVPALSSVALFSVGGLIGAWLTVVVFLPVATRRAHSLRPGLVAFVVPVLLGLGRLLSPARFLLWVLTLAAVVTILIASESDDDPRRLIDLSPELIADARAIGDVLPEVNGAELLVIEGSSLDEIYARLEALYEAVDTTTRLSSVLDWLPSPQHQQANRVRSRVLLAEGGVAEVVLSELGSVDVSEHLSAMRETLDQDARAPLDTVTLLANKELGLPPLLARDGRSVVALALVSGGDGDKGLQDYVAAQPKVNLLNTVADTELAMARQRTASFTVLGVGFAIVALVLLLVYRRPFVLVIMGVPAGAVIGTLALLALLGEPLTLFHAVGLFLVLGLGMDYAIFLNELDDRAPQATRIAIVLSAATSLVSFGVLGLSSIPVARFFGQIVFIGNALNLVLSFVLLAYLETRRSTRPLT